MTPRDANGTPVNQEAAENFVALPGLREARERAGLSRAQLARLADASIETIKSAEDGRRTPYLATAERIARALGVPLASLTNPR